MLSLLKRTDKRIVLLPTEELCPNPMQPRKQFDEADLLALAESIRQYGILQPVTVRPADPLPYPDELRSPSFEIIAGERRWRAAKMAGLEKIPCIIRKADKQQSAELALIENVQRRDLGYFEEAEAIRNLLLMTSLSQTEMAARLSLSPSALSNKLRLLRLSPNERKLIEEHGLGERHARAFLRIHDETLRKQAIKQVITDGLSASETETLADRLSSIQTAFGDEQDTTEQELPEQQPEQQAPPDPAAKRQRISLIRDLRFFFNTLDRAASLVGEAGFTVTQERTETENGYDIRLSVSKKG